MEHIQLLNYSLELFCFPFSQANKRGPEFATLYQNTAQSLTVEFEALDLLIHEGVIKR